MVAGGVDVCKVADKRVICWLLGCKKEREGVWVAETRALT
jgi:hypothetical protein